MNNNSGNGGSAAMAGVAGAVVGAGVAVAATKLMSDKKTRDRVKATLTNVKDQVLEAIDRTAEVSQKGGTAIRQGKKFLAESQQKLSHLEHIKDYQKGDGAIRPRKNII